MTTFILKSFFVVSSDEFKVPIVKLWFIIYESQVTLCILSFIFYIEYLKTDPQIIRKNFQKKNYDYESIAIKAVSGYTLNVTWYHVHFIGLKGDMV